MPSFKSLLLIALSLAATTTACPQGWEGKDDQCCFGFEQDSADGNYCCVGGKMGDIFATTSSSSVSCFAQIPMTASDYSQQVSSASSKYQAGATTTPATNVATSTSSGSAAATANAAIPIATAQEIVLGGAAVIAGLFVL
ncbi:hypothetical protein N7448_007229 [Penicillium atrosanguineum]|uniref:Extracellular membrane protein CFEM domain-containing protein n=1 Tax=Penicillium atrosanguineum TaxID=1132637 RepID=A0A9W9PUW3_9EURO|nr:uncharacterized protein N7443_010999 [Penicillium atrosanguineum]KAJ5133071.1 hypothetical protein N7448_007229 [Penicillium atrosanguineum]KAJ5141035.1 hypothetical protein N7526_002030 [Penicillium atrosanguineum]KAJ5290746.1 hypothetical protein N7443_010999 [Penicillium atrosanguineum]KAJ5308560.1 hypothetical protein N7476_009216 [Penicillium atrosanguineum]